MNKLTMFVLVAIMLLGSTTVSSSEFRMKQPTGIPYERILAFLERNNVSNPYYKARILSTAKRPFTMTAIAFVESKGTIEHVTGTCGEVSAFQILRPPKDFNKYSLVQSMQWAEAHLDREIMRHKSYYNGIRQYNGSIKNKKTAIYANRIQEVIKQI